MLRSSFAFLRGSAALMVHDLATTPSIGIQLQACGGCHLMNFGLLATPERNLDFDLNDFDESLPTPWEWDIKRLAASFAVAGRDNHLSDTSHGTPRWRACAPIGKTCANTPSWPLEVWYSCRDAESLIETAPDEKVKKLRQQLTDIARARVVENIFPQDCRACSRAPAHSRSTTDSLPRCTAPRACSRFFA